MTRKDELNQYLKELQLTWPRQPYEALSEQALKEHGTPTDDLALSSRVFRNGRLLNGQWKAFSPEHYPSISKFLPATSPSLTQIVNHTLSPAPPPVSTSTHTP